jgi:eukaryotic-like serine/threonine-protein kinase
LRIADFGLARALAEAAWTEPMGAVLGTARYASPEQARGAPLDGKSDVYSLGLVLIEAVTGEVPFTADTTLGTLMARVDRPVPVPDELGSLQVAIARAGAPDPQDRPDAAELSDLLMEAAGHLARPEPLPLAGAMSGDLTDVDERDPTTQYLAERKAVAGLEPEIMLAPPGTTTDGIQILHEGEGQPETRRIARPVPDDDAADAAPGSARRVRRAAKKAARAERRAERRARRTKPRRWPRVLAVTAIVLGLAAGGWAYWYTQVREPTFAIPALVGANVADLGDLLVEGRFEVTIDEIRRDDTVPGQILDQEPPPGTRLREGEPVALTVSLGPTLVVVPGDLAGLPLEEATARLAAAGLAVGEVSRPFDEEVPADSVIALGPGVAAELPKGSEVPLVVSAGPEPRTVPDDLIGASREQAVARLAALGLQPDVEGEFSDDVPEGVVMAVPAAGTQVARDSTVALVVSRGPETVAVPDVRGNSAAEAAQRLQAAGLRVSGTQGSPANAATGTNPSAGTIVRKDTAVTIITS